MASPPLCIAVLVVSETSSSVTVPPTRQGPCSDSARPGPTPEAIAKTSGLWSAGTYKTPKEDLGERWPRLTGMTAALTKSREFQHSWWGCRTGERRPRVPTRPHFRELLRERQKLPYRKKKTLSTGAVRWPWDHPPGDQYPTLGPEDWLQPNVVASAQKVIFHVGILHEFSVVAR